MAIAVAVDHHIHCRSFKPSLSSRSSSDFFAVLKPSDATEPPALPSVRSPHTSSTTLPSLAPPTALVRISYPTFGPCKAACIQHFMPHLFDIGDLGGDEGSNLNIREDEFLLQLDVLQVPSPPQPGEKGDRRWLRRCASTSAAASPLLSQRRGGGEEGRRGGEKKKGDREKGRRRGRGRRRCGG